MWRLMRWQESKCLNVNRIEFNKVYFYDSSGQN